MKAYTLLLSFVLLAVSCNSNPPPTKDIIQDQLDEIKETTHTQGKEGRGKITMSCAGKTFEINGVCGAVVSMGTLTVAVPDDKAPTKTFTISFKTDKLPSASRSYDMVKSRFDDENPDHVVVSYSDFSHGATNTWESDDATGKLKFDVNGNTIRCTFSNLKLLPNEFFNKGDLNNTATVSGELTIYKN